MTSRTCRICGTSFAPNGPECLCPVCDADDSLTHDLEMLEEWCEQSDRACIENNVNAENGKLLRRRR